MNELKQDHYGELQKKVKELETAGMKNTMAMNLKEKIYKDTILKLQQEHAADQKKANDAHIADLKAADEAKTKREQENIKGNESDLEKRKAETNQLLEDHRNEQNKRNEEIQDLKNEIIKIQDEHKREMKTQQDYLKATQD